ncbi:peptidase domain-containing ABC transporter [Undibacterium sp. Dicai25W]|uniref:peptidase domain-containing ABC transporter n=1 Tax=Undibacterium sp. Dicai25W TaxID=3413034 RepID=UPI003BF39E44
MSTIDSFLTMLQTSWRRRLPVLRQTEAAECGLACVTMVASYYGKMLDLAQLRRQIGISLLGMTMFDMINVAKNMDMSGRALRLELSELTQLKCPAILHWNMNHFVVLKKVGRRHIIIHDPASGIKKLSFTEFSQHFTGIALELEPTEKFQKEDTRNAINLRSIMGKVDGLNAAMVHILLLSLVMEIFVLATPLVMQLVTDEVLVSFDRDLLVLLIIGTIGLGIAKTMTNFVRGWVITHISTRLNVLWQTRVFEHLLKLPLAYFEKRHVGDIVSRFESLHSIQEMLTMQLIEGILDGVVALIAFVLMLMYSPTLAFVALGFVLSYGLLRWLRFRPVRYAQEAQIVSRAELESHFLETVRGMQTVKLFSGGDIRRDEWLRRLIRTTNEGLRLRKLDLLFHIAQGLLVAFEHGLVLWLGAQAVLGGVFSVGALLAYLSWKDQFISGLDALIDKLANLGMIRLYAERLSDIVQTEPEELPQIPFLGIGELQSGLELHNVCFRYGSFLPRVIDAVSLKVHAGEYVAIAGRSGLGKTTLLKLMLGLLSPEQGELKFGGVNINQLGSEYRKRIAAVMQSDHLLAGSLAENIAFFDAQADQQWIEECAKLACLHEEILAMPMGYNTLVGDMGSALSGGQKQRLLLARALYRRPQILFMDEATSNLDVSLEFQINENIKRLSITRIAVAHRPQTLAMADRVIDLNPDSPSVNDLPTYEQLVTDSESQTGFDYPRLFPL